MRDLLVLSDLEQVKALAVPLRVEIVMTLHDKPMTTSQVAAILGERPNRLYYHVTELEKVGILEVVETRQRGNLVEKYYRPVARILRIDPTLFSHGAEGQEAYIKTVLSQLDSTILEIRRGMSDGGLSAGDMNLAFSSIIDLGLTPAQLREFHAEIREAILRWTKRSDNSLSTRAHLTTVFFPSKRPKGAGD